ncbi:PAS domain S-box protein [Mesorhizobium sp.]|uniref:PAS domain S-box protein n=1 Tax=Mesorhizobium sp. TaxID=1871066 RepID=UPI0026978AEE
MRRTPAASLPAFANGSSTGRPTGRTWRHVKADGSLIDVIAHSKRIDYDGRATMMVAVIDVTERKRAEDDLRRTRQFLDTMIENIPVML